MLGTQRTGSSALTSALNNYRQIACGNEWILRAPTWRKLAYARRFLDDASVDMPLSVTRGAGRLTVSSKPERAAVGFKILFRSSALWWFKPDYSPSIVIDRLRGILSWLESDTSIAVIHITRSDHVAWARSKYLSQMTNLFFDTAYPTTQIGAINIDSAVRAIKSKILIDREITLLQRRGNFLRIDYECFKDNIEVAASLVKDLICPEAERDFENCYITKPQTTDTVNCYNQITNYDALKKRLQAEKLL